ncbi:MAG: hypothetical protein AAGA06_06395 [Pseudomonadota bacterium]
MKPKDVANILENIGSLVADFHASDVALQNAISSLTRTPGQKMDMGALQHIDLLTQSHDDLSKLLFALGACLRDEAMSHADLRRVLRLRSLQDTLIAGKNGDDASQDAGVVSLF